MSEGVELGLIREEDIDRLRLQMPDYIVEQGDDVQDLWIATEWAKEQRDLSPKRYYSEAIITGYNDDGTEVKKEINIDFQQTVNPGAIVKAAGGDTTAVRRVNAMRLQYQKLDYEYQKAQTALNQKLGVKARKSRNIVDYTGQILEMFGKFYTVTDVVKVLAKEYRIKVPEDELKKFYVENRDLITRRRAEYVLTSKDFRVATETGRLEVLNQLLIDAQLKNNAAGGANLDYSNLIIRILEQARKEVKGNDLKLTVDGKIDINATLHAETNILTVMKQLSINALVIGLTAAKAGLNPATLIAQLSNSWYSKFNGFNANVMDGEEVQLPSVLIKSYNWDEIAVESRKFIGEFQPIGSVINGTEGEDALAEERRLELLRRLKGVRMSRGQGDKNDPFGSGVKEVEAVPVANREEPSGEFVVDYSKRSDERQAHGIRVKGSIKESIARHKEKREAEEALNRVESDLASAEEKVQLKRAVRKKKAQTDADKEDKKD